MNLKDRMRSAPETDQTEHSAVIGNPEKELKEKSELVAQPAEQSAQDKMQMDLLRKQITEMAEEIQRNLSEISLLKKELQEKSETIVLLNERIVTLSGSDKELKQSEELLRKSEELNMSASATIQEAESMKSASDAALKKAEITKKSYEQKIKALDEQVDRTADVKIREERNKLRKECEVFKTKLDKTYKKKYSSIRLLSLLGGCFGITATVLSAITSERFISDLSDVFRYIWTYMAGVIGKTMEGASWAWQLKSLIDIPVLGFITAILAAVICGAAVLAIGYVLPGYLVYKGIKIGARYMKDSFTITIAVISGVTVIWFADSVTITVNLIIIWLTGNIIINFIRRLVIRKADHI